ncbi:Cof-type HAD-IIB family hydrolase [Peribacillus frigoritolerans]|uniref:Cof-type HAD-IIB family hydrolase n=1 Tax=Peribacillus frigoritolerans TaxID=450367 RepID=UPI00105A4FCC|nr:Cof-type HAD-IIB family hydrolase [Peribacillus frigoritolerans]TDL80789.1 HAD family phosphatase [Peribacillus frigoritolerans]
MIYRLLALNIDGTLLRSNGRLQPSTREAIHYVQKKGVYVTLVTSRHFQTAKKLAKALKINNILITHSGAFISDKVDRSFYENRISEEKTFNLVQVLETFDCNVRIVHERFSLGNRKKVSSNIVGKTLLSPTDPLFYPVQFVDSLGENLRDEPLSAPKIEVYFSEEHECQEVEKVLSDAFVGITIRVKNPTVLEITAKGVSKENGLRLLGQHLNIMPEEMVAIGDADDDKEMIEMAGLGVAMGNAPNHVKKAADWITRNNDDQGVSYMVKEHFRKQHRIEFLDKLKVDR